MKTLAIRLEEDQHAQLSTIAQLEDLTMIDAIRQAINDWVAARRDKPELKERAAALLSEIEQEAATRRGAIAALLGQAEPEGAASTATSGKEEPPQSGRRKGATGSEPNRSPAPPGGASATS